MSEILLKHFALLAASEGGVAKLRELILSLAVRGKLVPQDPKDEPASELLKRISAEKERLEAEGKFKRGKALPVNGEEEKPFELPEGWVWASFAMLGSFGGGKTPSTVKSDYWGGEIPWVTPKDMKSLVISDAQDKVTQRAVEDGLAVFEANSVMIVVRSGILRRMVPVAVSALPCTVNQDLKVLTLAMPVMATYVQLMIRGFESFILQNLTKVGTTVESIRFDDFERQPFPLPPLPEQSRIVAKVEALMALCDRLEAQQGDAARVQAYWTQAALDQLAESGDADEFARHWQALAEHFDTLFATPASIDALDATLLQLAVRGQLVPQNPADEPASELLQKIRTEKDRLIAEGKIKRDKPLPPIANDEKPFDLPRGWEWARWNDFALQIGDIDHKMPLETPTGFPYVSPKDFGPENVIDFDGAKKISEEDFVSLSLKIKPEVGDLIYPRYGTIGNVRLVLDDREFLASYSCAIIKTMPHLINPMFQYQCSISGITRTQAEQATNKTTQPNVGLKSIQAYVLPLPPLPEQSRIVAKLDELLALTRTLRARLTEANAVQARLASALVDEVAA